VAANIAGRRSHYFHQPSKLPSVLGRHLFDKFCARTQNGFSIYFDSGFAVRREISKIILLLIVMWLIECCLN